MRILENKQNNAVVFTIEGRLDSSTSEDVEKKLLESIASGTKNIILNFSTLDYISSSGIRILIHCHKELEKKNGNIFLVAVPAPIENILYITGFLPYFKIFESEELALKSLK